MHLTPRNKSNMPSDIQTTFTTAFQEAQLSFGKHKKAAAMLYKLKSTSDAQAFQDEFFACVSCVLTVYKREPAAERIVEFIVAFATQSAEGEAYDESFMQSLCMRLLKLAGAKDKAVRFRVAQLVGRMLNSMADDAEEAEVSDELFEAVEEAMIVRCNDKDPLVRAWALKALYRLQNPLEASDTITHELLRLMADDAKKEVRMAAISTVAPSKHAIKAILGRTRDVSEDVRLHALDVLEKKVEMRWLSISQRNALMQTCLRDRQPKVRKACAQLVGSWLRKADGQPMVLLKALDVSNNEATALLVVQAMLSGAADREGTAAAAPLVAKAAAEEWEPALEAASAAGVETVVAATLCLRAHLQHIAESAKDDAAREAALEAARPELVPYCQRVQLLHRALREAADAGQASRADKLQFGLAQLLRAAPQLDFFDEHGRRDLELALVELIQAISTRDALLPQLMGALKACAADKFQTRVLEAIADVEDPLTDGADGPTRTRADAAAAEADLQREEEAMMAEAKLAELAESLQTAVEVEDFERATTLKKEVQQLKARLDELRGGGAPALTDMPQERTRRCLRLVELLLQEPLLKLGGIELERIEEGILVPAVTAADTAELRALALRGLSLHCHASVEAARKFWPMFLHAMEHDQPPVQLASLRAVLDLLHLHGPASLLPAAAEPPAPGAAGPSSAAAPAAPHEDGHAAEVAKLLLPLLEREAVSSPLRSAAAVGLAKLLHSRRLASSSLLARLLLVYFQPVDADAAAPAPPAVKRAGSGDMAADAAADAATALKQHLAVFFAASGGQAPLAAALLPALRTALAAPPGSADAGVPVDQMVQFALSLCRQEPATATAAWDVEKRPLHEELALALCCEMLLGAEDKEGRALAKALPHLALDAETGATRLPQLAALLARVAASMTDKASLRHVHKLQERLQLLLATDAPADASGESGGAEAGSVGPTAEEILAAHAALRDADADGAAAREREKRRSDEAAEDAAQRVLTPSKAAAKDKKKPGRRGLTKAKATPSRFAGVENEVGA